MAKKANIAATVGVDGEKEFRQAITNINSDMKVLASEMKKVSSEFSDNAKSVDALTAKDKVLNEQIDKQKTKVEELRKAMENSKEQYPDNIKKLNDWKSSLNTAEAKLFDMTREVDMNKKALEEAKNPTVQLAKEVTDLGNAANKSGGHALKMGDIIKANLISAAIINGVKQLAYAFKDMASGALNAADEIATLAGQTGFSAEEIQVWQYVGKGLDIEVETITGSISKLTRAMTAAKNGTKAQADAFETLRVKVINTDGSLRDSKVVLGEAITALGKMGNETDRDSLSLILFGKSALEMNPLIKAGADRVTELTDAAYKNGAVMSDATIEGLDKFKDSTEMMGQEIQALVGNVLVELMPAFNDLIAWFRDNKQTVTDFALNAVGAVADGFQWIIDNKDNIGKGFDFILNAVKGFSDNKDLIVTAIMGIAGAFVAAAIAAGSFQSAWSIGINAAFIVAGIYAISSAIDAVTGKASKVPNITKATIGTAKVAQQTATIGTGSRPTGGSATQSGYSLMSHADGGIFNQPTLFRTPRGYHQVGEAGMEAVLPLSKLPGLLGLNNQPQITVSTLKQALSGMRIEMGEDGFASLVDKQFVKAMAR